AARRPPAAARWLRAAARWLRAAARWLRAAARRLRAAARWLRAAARWLRAAARRSRPVACMLPTLEQFQTSSTSNTIHAIIAKQTAGLEPAVLLLASTTLILRQLKNRLRETFNESRCLLRDVGAVPA